MISWDGMHAADATDCWGCRHPCAHDHLLCIQLSPFTIAFWLVQLYHLDHPYASGHCQTVTHTSTTTT